MKAKAKSKVTRSLALVMAFAVALCSSILFAPKAAYAAEDSYEVIWDNEVLSEFEFDEEKPDQSSRGITFHSTWRSNIYQSASGPAIKYVAADPTSFSSNTGNIKKIVISASEISKGMTDSMNLSDGWEYESESNTFTWNGTPTSNIPFSFGNYSYIVLNSIVFTMEGSHTHSWNTGIVTKSPTCTTTGVMTYTCIGCGQTKTEKLEAIGHDWSEWEVVQKATETKEGKEVRYCYNDDSHVETRTIPKVKPAPTPAPKNDSLSLNTGLKASQTGSKLTVKWGKVSGATYEVFVTDGKKFPKKATLTVKTTKVSITKLNGKKLNLKKIFKIYVVAKKKGSKVGKSMTCYVAGRKNAKYTNTKKVKLAKSGVTLKVGKTSKIKATTIPENPKKKVLSYEGAYRYLTTNKNVATVNAKGKVTAKHKGNCYIYVYANNGFQAKFKVTVK